MQCFKYKLYPVYCSPLEYKEITNFILILVCSNSGPLGMISGDIQDSQITASSSYPAEWEAGCGTQYARPYLENKLAWCARVKSSSEWIQIDLGVVTEVRQNRTPLLTRQDNFSLG